jgi:formamidopyrimidine-DNA glycosylase
MADLGPEPFDDAFAAWLDEADDRRRLHTILRDQRTVAGIGRGHADDILHRVKLAPTRSLRSLSPEERSTLLDAVRADLDARIEHERTRCDGLPAKLSEDWRVHGKWGSPCPTCTTELARISYEGYEITYCPTCQTDGRVLADRRRSRFLK